jgi:hypothetical protein
VGFSLIDELIWSPDGDRDQKYAKEFIELIVAPFVRSISNAGLGSADQRIIKKIVLEEHILCSLCVYVLKIIERFKTEPEVLLDEIADAVIQPLVDRKILSQNVQDDVRVALRTGVRASAAALLTSLDSPMLLDLICLVGIVTCPNISEHSDVEQYCITPLLGRWITPEVLRWVSSGFSAEDPLLMSRNRRS